MTQRNYYSPRNTSEDDPFLKLLVGMEPNGIEAQEAQGQREMVGATTLPTEMGDQSRFEALGFTFGEVVKGDPLFREATLPEGWTREGSDHAMHSYIVDQRGIRRVGVFYKAAFYDRRADMHIENVGYSVSSGFIYGDGALGTFALPDGLTDEERAQVRANAESYVKNAEEHPSIYGDRLPRAREVLAKSG